MKSVKFSFSNYRKIVKDLKQASKYLSILQPDTKSTNCFHMSMTNSIENYLEHVRRLLCDVELQPENSCGHDEESILEQSQIMNLVASMQKIELEMERTNAQLNMLNNNVATLLERNGECATNSLFNKNYEGLVNFILSNIQTAQEELDNVWDKTDSGNRHAFLEIDVQQDTLSRNLLN